jgi:hypothetical protein
MSDDFEDEDNSPRTALRGWLIVCAISVAFVLYGFFAFFVIGDKGPPDWDYGSIPDVPAQSTYSTYPFRGDSVQPEPQHVDKRPARGAIAGENAPEKNAGQESEKR